MLKVVRQWIEKYKQGGQNAELAFGSAFLLVAKVFGALSAYVLAYLLAKRGGAAAVGVYELAFTFIILLSVVARFGLDTAIVRYIGVFNAQKMAGAIRWLYRHSMLFSAVFAFFIGLVVYVSAPYISRFFSDQNHLTEPLRWAAFAIPAFTLLNMNAETLRGFKKMGGYSLLQQGSVIFFAALIFGLWWQPQNIGLSGVKAFFWATSVLFVASQWQVKRSLVSIPPTQKPNISFANVQKVAWPMFLSSSIFMLISWTDTLMIGYFMKDADVGIYRIAFRVSTVITFTQFAINGIAAPMIADLYHANNREGLWQLIKKVGLFNFVFSVPIVLIIFAFPTQLLQLFGATFGQGKDLLLLLSAGQAVFALSGPVLYILTMTKHEKTALNIMYITAALNLLGNATLIPIFGLKGAAIATMATTMLWNILAVIYVYRYLGVISAPFLSALAKPDFGNKN